jgi:hypothetical protein
MTRHSGFASWQEHTDCSEHVSCLVQPASSASEALSLHYYILKHGFDHAAISEAEV